MSERSKLRTRKELVKLSRTVSHALRHAPDEYGLILDGSGWVDIPVLLDALACKSGIWKALSAEDLYEMAAAGEKQRYEITESRIRAIYGHSVSSPVEYEEAVPPDVLYHGTTEKSAISILGEGIKSMKRQYVHLSPDIETATEVALRRTAKPVLLKVDAKAAYLAGTRFYKGNDSVWLTKEIDRAFIER